MKDTGGTVEDYARFKYELQTIDDNEQLLREYYKNY